MINSVELSLINITRVNTKLISVIYCWLRQFDWHFGDNVAIADMIIMSFGMTHCFDEYGFKLYRQYPQMSTFLSTMTSCQLKLSKLTNCQLGILTSTRSLKILQSNRHPESEFLLYLLSQKIALTFDLLFCLKRQILMFFIFNRCDLISNKLILEENTGI